MGVSIVSPSSPLERPPSSHLDGGTRGPMLRTYRDGVGLIDIAATLETQSVNARSYRRDGGSLRIRRQR